MLIASVCLTVSGCEGSQSSDGPEKGDALSGGNHSGGTAGYPFAAVGEKFWFAMPLSTNVSDQDIEITGAEILDVPRGIEVIGYGAYSLDDTQGIPLLVSEGYVHTPKFGKFKDYSDEGFTVKAKKVSDFLYMAHLRVTGSIQTNASKCRFEYRQGDVMYTQTLRCGLELRLKKK
ncbi:hypothetical protein [Streptomyces sp. NPDC047097]|uniref:hypothetical protein n=1 Tax=Streptomyces sp. NPDC047097 TaxID=3155260 RepID=UPI0033F1EB8D